VCSEVGNDSAIAGALSRLFRNAELRHRMGMAARQRMIENYSVDKIVDRYEALFREALAP